MDEAAKWRVVSLDNNQTLTMRLRASTCAREWEEFAQRIRKETIQDRTIPVLSRVDAVAAIMQLPHAEEPTEGVVVSKEDEQKAELVQLLRGILAKLTADGKKPGLVLLREPRARAS